MNRVLRFNEQQAIEFIRLQHTKWYDIIRKQVIISGCGDLMSQRRLPLIPEVVIVDSVFRACGQYRRDLNQCTYSLPYCAYDGAGYWTTIAHEICHAFIGAIDSQAPSHGRSFQSLITMIGLDPSQEIYHSYPIATVIDVAEQLKAARGGTSDTISFLQRRKTLKDIMQERNKRKG